MKGIYILEIKLEKTQEIEIGALGKITFEEGFYYYVGSAQNNLQKRIERHLSNNKKLHWHIDYLLSNENAKIESVYYKEDKKECKTAQDLTANGSPIKNFGSSDCKCTSHLTHSKYKLNPPKNFQKFVTTKK